MRARRRAWRQGGLRRGDRGPSKGTRAAGDEVQEVVMTGEGHFISESALFVPQVTALLARHGLRIVPTDLHAVDASQLPVAARAPGTSDGGIFRYPPH